MEPDFVTDGRKATLNLHEKLLGDDVVDVEDGEVMMDQAMMQASSGNVETGEKQPNQYRDVWAAVLFLAAQSVLGYLAFAWGIPALHYEDDSSSQSSSNNDDDSSISFTGILLLLLTSSVAALVISGLALAILMRAAHQLIQASLLLTVVSDVVLILFFISQGFWMGAVASLFFLALAAFYAMAVWRRVPFAAANLQTALTAVQSNGGLVVTAYGITTVVNLFSIIWLLAWLGVYVRSADCSDQVCTSHMNPFVVASFLLMFYWTSAVGKNVLHVTTAGGVGTWWFAPDEACTFCSPAVNDSLVRASTFSIGSICMGSLLTAILQTLYHMAHSARRAGRGHDFLLCIVECVVGCLERLIAYFNKWAYVYIGLYGYDYLTAGKKVTALFLERGWTAIINDNLVTRVLTLICVVIGMLTGCVGLLLASASPGWVSELGSSATAFAFTIPALIGTAMAYILMGVVASAVDTVVVAFCEAPLEFEQNHPGLSAQMVEAWRLIYPEAFGR